MRSPLEPGPPRRASRRSRPDGGTRLDVLSGARQVRRKARAPPAGRRDRWPLRRRGLARPERRDPILGRRDDLAPARLGHARRFRVRHPRLHAEARLAITTALLRATIDCLEDGVLAADIDGEILVCNDAGVRNIALTGDDE